jgi:hypothetical protein
MFQPMQDNTHCHAGHGYLSLRITNMLVPMARSFENTMPPAASGQRAPRCAARFERSKGSAREWRERGKAR